MDKRVYVNFDVLDNSTCKYCRAVMEFIDELFSINLKTLLPQRNFSSKSLLYVVNEANDEIIETARTPNEVRNVLRDYKIVEIPEDFAHKDVSTMFIKLNPGKSTFRNPSE